MKGKQKQNMNSLLVLQKSPHTHAGISQERRKYGKLQWEPIEYMYQYEPKKW